VFELWAVWAGSDVGLAAHGVRAGVLIGIGLLTGHLAGEMRRALDAAAIGALHFELSGDMLGVADFDGNFVDIGGRWEETLGWTREELMARPFLHLVHPEDRESTFAASTQPSAGFVNRCRTRDGVYRWIEWSAHVDPERRLTIAAARDVTDRMLAEQRFRRSFEDSHAAMALVGVGGGCENRILEANDALADLLGLTLDVLQGMKTPLICADPAEEPALREALRALHAGEVSRHHQDLRIRRGDGSPVWVEFTTSIVRDAGGDPLYRMTQLVDVSARKAQEEVLVALAEQDALTGVYNRRGFEVQLERELRMTARKGSRGALCLLDLDHFKAVNDTLGHAAGDAVLAKVADALVDRLRATDTVARIGGDEFAVLLRRVGPVEAGAIADDLVRAVEEAVDGAIGVSIGVASFGEPPVSLPDLMQAADRAMYAAKGAGRGRAVCV
jgi:diguanylate cyclase (GGDEF)-like protein/PAS domain S-box-containing protein